MRREESALNLKVIGWGLLMLMALWPLLSVAQVDDNALVPAKCHDITVPHLNAAEAIRRLARQTGTKLLFDYDQVEVRQAQPVRGCLSVLEAMDVMLKGSGLVGVRSSEGVFAILVKTPIEQDEIR